MKRLWCWPWAHSWEPWNVRVVTKPLLLFSYTLDAAREVHTRRCKRCREWQIKYVGQYGVNPRYEGDNDGYLV